MVGNMFAHQVMPDRPRSAFEVVGQLANHCSHLCFSDACSGRISTCFLGSLHRDFDAHPDVVAFVLAKAGGAVEPFARLVELKAVFLCREATPGAVRRVHGRN